MAKGKYQQWLEPEGLLLLESWARDGLTDEQIAHNMGISPKTLYEWKNKYGEICKSLKKGKEIVDIQVENALIKRALGYSYQEERVEISDKDGKKVVQTIKHVPGDTTAQIFWLKNRRPDKFRDKPPEPKPERKANNLFEQIQQSMTEVNADGVPEIQQTADSDDDVVEASAVP